MCFSFAACQSDAAISTLKQELTQRDLPRVQELIAADIEAHLRAVSEASKRLAPGFVVQDPALREKQMRTALRWLRKPKEGVAELVTSPLSFIAAIDQQGMVIARDTKPDLMKGQDFAARYPLVKDALKNGTPAYALLNFGSAESKIVAPFVFAFAAPVTHANKKVGAVLVGIPLQRIARRLTRQLRLESIARNAPKDIWVYLEKDGRWFQIDNPPDLTEYVESKEQGEIMVQGSRFIYARASLTKLPDVFVALFRAAP